jgi:predicted alternative tryptophan synthase beta-subunit
VFSCCRACKSKTMSVANSTAMLRTSASTLADLIGNTPLLELKKLNRNPRVEIYAKAEWANPGGSVKDRPALKMLTEGLQTGALTPDKTIIDATSGNTGIAYAMLGAAFGYRVKLCLPKNASAERKRILRAYGAELVLTDPLAGTKPGSVFLSRPVQQSGQLAGALRDDRPRDIPANRWPRHSFFGWLGNQRHICRCGAFPARTQAGD